MSHENQEPIRIFRKPQEVDRMSVSTIKTLEGAFVKCAEVLGLEDKTIAADIGMDNALWSRTKTGEAGLKGDRILRLMEASGNDLPLFWLAYARGYDPRSLRKLESDLERENRELREKVEAQTEELKTITKFMQAVRA